MWMLAELRLEKLGDLPPTPVYLFLKYFSYLGGSSDTHQAALKQLYVSMFILLLISSTNTY